jgi:hypothetical protein
MFGTCHAGPDSIRGLRCIPKGVGGQVLFFAYPIKAVKGQAERVEFKGGGALPFAITK